MTFDAILDQVITLLKRQGRVSYPALKLRFNLDDEYLEALKAELLYVHPVRDDDGRGLIWTGDTASGQAVAPQPAQPTPQPAAQAQPSTQVEPLSTAPPPDAERRQLTVMFCDLVNSTKLSIANSTRKTGVTWSVHINRCVPKLSSAMMDISPNFLAMVSWSILAILKPMKMMPTEQYGRG